MGFFESRRWPHGRFCPECGSVETYSHKSRKSITTARTVASSSPARSRWARLEYRSGNGCSSCTRSASLAGTSPLCSLPRSWIDLSRRPFTCSSASRRSAETRRPFSPGWSSPTRSTSVERKPTSTSPGSAIWVEGRLASSPCWECARGTGRRKSKEYVRGDVHTNSIESAWVILKRTIMGVRHHISVKHLRRYLNEVC